MCVNIVPRIELKHNIKILDKTKVLKVIIIKDNF